MIKGMFGVNKGMKISTMGFLILNKFIFGFEINPWPFTRTQF